MTASGTRLSRYPLVDRSLAIAGMTVPNRVVRTAHTTGFGDGGVTDELIAFHERRAAGGVGLVILGDGAPHPTANGGVHLWDPTVVPGLRRLTAAVHRHGAVAFQQLTHQGAAAAGAEPPWSASSVPLPLTGRSPIAMTRSMIDEIVAGHAAAAQHCRDAGTDGVEIHAGHGGLIGQFLSPLSNDRTDEFGGSVANRKRLLERILRAVRAAVPALAVGVRVSVAENVPGGLEPADTVGLLAGLEKAGLVDFVDLSTGHLTSYPTIVGGLHEPHGYQLDASAPVAAGVSVPTIVTGRFHRLAEAERALADGSFDLVGMARATIAEPDLVRLSQRGEAARARPCIACNVCVAAMVEPPRRLVCAANPRVGREGSAEASGASARRSVLVVGGGPAGMEAAIAAAERGHAVTLCEADGVLGGSVRVAALAPTRGELADLVEWQQRRIVELDVEVRTRTVGDVRLVRVLAPEVVVIATGATHRTDGLQVMRPAWRPDGLDESRVVTAVDVLTRSIGRTVSTAVVLDDRGTHDAVAVAEVLAGRGTEVHVVTRFAEVAAGLGPTLELEPAQRRLAALGVEVSPRSVIESVGDRDVVVRSLLTDRCRSLPAELVVVVSAPVSRRELATALTSSPAELVVVGDALAPRDIATAVAEGDRAGREI